MHRRWWGVVGLGLLLVAVIAGLRGQREWVATGRPPDGPVVGSVVLMGDPVPLRDGGWRAEVRHEGRRLHAEFGAAHREIAGLLAGQSVQVEASVVRPARRWERIRHVAGTIEVDEVGSVGPAGRIHRAANDLRRLLERGAGSLADDQRALLAGLVYGDDRAQSETTADDFRAAGLGHLLAVSGQNVAFVLAAAAPILGRLRFTARVPLTLALLSFFAVVTRFEPSVLRATVMAGGSALSVAVGRRQMGFRLLAATVLLLIVVDPLLVHRAAFRLSVAASAGILLAARPLADLLVGPRALRDAVAVTLAAQAAVTPLLLAGFGPVPVAALPANVLAAPVAGPLMVWGVTGGLVAGLLDVVGWAWAARTIHLPTGLGLDWVAAVAGGAADHRTGLLGPASGTAGVGLVGTAAVLSGMGARRLGRATLVATLVLAATVAVASLSGAVATGTADGVRVLGGEPRGVVVVVDRSMGPQRLLEVLRTRGVDDPALVIFREPVTSAVAGALESRYGPHARWGPAGSVGAVVPADGQRVKVGGTTWVVHLRPGRLLVRRAAGEP